MNESYDEQPKTNLRLDWVNVHWILPISLGTLSSSIEQSREPEAGKISQGGPGGKPKLVAFYGNDEKADIGMRASPFLSWPKAKKP